MEDNKGMPAETWLAAKKSREQVELIRKKKEKMRDRWNKALYQEKEKEKEQEEEEAEENRAGGKAEVVEENLEEEEAVAAGGLFFVFPYS